MDDLKGNCVNIYVLLCLIYGFHAFLQLKVDNLNMQMLYLKVMKGIIIDEPAAGKCLRKCMFA